MKTTPTGGDRPEVEESLAVGQKGIGEGPGNPFAAVFGQHMRYLREQVYGETLRAFADRLGLSAAYLSRIELGQVGEPRRETVIKMAMRLGVDPAGMLVKAGYAPQVDPARSEYEHITLKLDLMRQDVREVAIVLIDALMAAYPRRKRET